MISNLYKVYRSGDGLILCLIVALLLFIQKIYPITWRFYFVRSRENNLCMYLMITVTLNTICVWHQVSSGICCVCLINLLSIKLLSSISKRLKGAYSQCRNTNLVYDEYYRWDIVRIMLLFFGYILIYFINFIIYHAK